jgi:phage-related protein (TIGR01555 family)
VQGVEQDPKQGEQASAAAERLPNGQFPPGQSGNPAGRRAKQIRQVRADGYVNAFTGHGTRRDRRTATRHRTTIINDLEAIDQRRGNWLAKRIIELLPDEGIRRGYQLKMPTKKQAEQVQSALESLGLNDKVKEAWQMERTVGGSALFPVLDGAVGELHDPLDLETPRIVSVKALHLLEARELTPASWYTDLTNPRFGRPETYRLWPLSGGGAGSAQTVIVHESRLAVFPGARFTREPLPGQRLGWGDTALTPVNEVLADFGLSWGSAATILHNFAQRVIKFDRLAEILAEADGEAIVQKRFTVMDMAANVLQALPLDKEDEFVTMSTSVAGLADLLVQFAQLIAAAADMPLTRLFGMSPAGMNATGESDTRGWYDRVGNGQARLTPLVEWMIRLVLLSTEGPTNGKEPDTWSLEWLPLWTPSEKEEAERRLLVAQSDKIYYEMQSASNDDIAKSRWGGDTYSPDMTIDWKAREAQRKADEQAAEQLAAGDLDPADVAALGHKPASAEPPVKKSEPEAA